MSLFSELQQADILDPLLGIYKDIPAEGKIKLVSKIEIPNVWIHSVRTKDRDCARFKFYFNSYKLIPKNCTNCWKIVFSPATLKEAFDVVDLQRELDYPSKTGMETREYTGNKGGYSSFWYCPMNCGLHVARGRYEIVKEALAKKLKREVKVILKRGCTEFERTYGASDEWEKRGEERNWELKEALLDSVFEDDGCWRDPVTPSFIEVNTRLHMIYWAFEHGDETYKLFTGGAMLTPLVTYHDSIHADIDFPEVKHDSSLGHKDAREGSAEAKVEVSGSVPGDGRILTLVPPVESTE